MTMKRWSIVLVLASISAAHADPPPVVTGPVAGAPGLVVAAKADATYCGGTAVTVVVTSRAGIDPELIAALTIAAPGDVDQLTAFMADATEKVKAAQDLYTKRATTDRVGSLARITQVLRRFAEVMIRFPIPESMRTGEHAAASTAAFCAQLEQVADPVLVKAEQAAAQCRETARTAGRGWWDAVCAK